MAWGDESGERVYENVWGHATGLDQRGRHKTLSSALDAALKDLMTERNEFYSTLVDNFRRLFPDSPARPGRYQDGRIYLYVSDSPTFFLLFPRLKAMAAKLRELPGAPRRIDLRLEIHAP